MTQAPRHKVFLSFHHEDQEYKDRFAQMMRGDAVDKSVEEGDIDESLKDDTIHRTIRDDFIRGATVTIVLVGQRTWQRKYVDWEISSSLRNTRLNPRCGLLGILLPNHPCLGRKTLDSGLVPPRLACNCSPPDPYSKIYDWTDSAKTVRGWIHEAFERRGGAPPNIGKKLYRRNRSGSRGGGRKKPIPRA